MEDLNNLTVQQITELDKALGKAAIRSVILCGVITVIGVALIAADEAMTRKKYKA